MNERRRRRAGNSSNTEGSGIKDTSTPKRIDPEKVRVVDVEVKASGEVLRRDCYDPDGGPAEMGDVLRIEENQLWLRTLQWARSKSPSADLTLTWESTGLSPEEVGRIGVFTWPIGDPVRVFAEKPSTSKDS